MLLIYCLILFLTIFLAIVTSLYFSLRKKSLLNAQRQQHLITSLKMETIRTRMSPHFLFNALSSISGGIIDPGTIKSQIKTLLILLRSSVDNVEQIAVPVSEELSLVKGYVDLISHSIPKPFQVNYEIQQGVNMDHLIPAMILQIPVENAIKHGLLPLPDEKILNVKIGKYESGLKLVVEDNGIGYLSSGKRAIGAGTGLKVLYQMIDLLNSLNKEKIEFTIDDKGLENNSAKGTIVEIRVPDNYSFKL